MGEVGTGGEAQIGLAGSPRIRRAHAIGIDGSKWIVDSVNIGTVVVIKVSRHPIWMDRSEIQNRLF